LRKDVIGGIQTQEQGLQQTSQGHYSAIEIKDWCKLPKSLSVFKH